MKKVLFIILDGWGINSNKKQSAIEQAKTPFIDSLYKKFPHTALCASEKHVGLPEGQMGNSEVGHMTIGAGRIIYQDLPKINNEIINGNFFKNKILKEIAQKLKLSKKKLHIIGLISYGGIHSNLEHFFALAKFFKMNEIEFLLHAITDGRDSAINDAKNQLQKIMKCLENNDGELATLTGRFYAMDRDKKWERTNLAFNAISQGRGEMSKDLMETINKFYENGIYDEFFTPTVSQKFYGKEIISEGDSIIFFNFRTDRMKQLVSQFLDKKKCNLYSFSDYGFENRVEQIFKREKIKNSLNDLLNQNNLSQLRIAETEKFPHVTYFFDNESNTTQNSEKNILCNSPKEKTYDLVPEMAAEKITDSLITSMEKKEYNFICVNYANADMVGHTGNFLATMKACEVIDNALKKIIPIALKKNYTILVTSDHGNADKMLNEDGSVCTTHSLNRVPFIFINNEGSLQKIELSKEGTLSDIAPTILQLLGIAKPEDMTGTSLLHQDVAT